MNAPEPIDLHGPEAPPWNDALAVLEYLRGRALAYVAADPDEPTEDAASFANAILRLTGGAE